MAVVWGVCWFLYSLQHNFFPLVSAVLFLFWGWNQYSTWCIWQPVLKQLQQTLFARNVFISHLRFTDTIRQCDKTTTSQGVSQAVYAPVLSLCKMGMAMSATENYHGCALASYADLSRSSELSELLATSKVMCIPPPLVSKCCVKQMYSQSHGWCFSLCLLWRTEL